MPRKSDNKTWKGSRLSELAEAVAKFLPKRGLPLITQRTNVRWMPRLLAVCAIFMAWAPGNSLLERFAQARDSLARIYDSRRRPGKTYEGFIAALAKRSDRLLKTITSHLRKRTQAVCGEFWQHSGWVPFGVDGSRSNCPMTTANEEAFGCAAKDKTTPQQLITTIFHVLTDLIWDWRVGHGRSSERGHLREMIAQLPRNVMLLADAGFTGYELFRQLMTEKRDFIIRVGRHVHLLKELGDYEQEDENTIYLWPKNRRQGQRRGEPLTLRLIRIEDQGKGKKKQPVYLITNVLDRKKLSDELAGQFYRLRWGIELHYRALKQTLDRRKMLSTSPAHATVELNWTLVGLWLLGLMTVSNIIDAGGDPRRWGVAQALRTVRRATRQCTQRCRRGWLSQELSQAVQDRYQRHGSKKSRNYPRKKTCAPPGTPKIRTATETEVQLAREVRNQKQAA